MPLRKWIHSKNTASWWVPSNHKTVKISEQLRHGTGSRIAAVYGTKREHFGDRCSARIHKMIQKMDAELQWQTAVLSLLQFSLLPVHRLHMDVSAWTWVYEHESVLLMIRIWPAHVGANITVHVRQDVFEIFVVSIVEKLAVLIGFEFFFNLIVYFDCVNQLWQLTRNSCHAGQRACTWGSLLHMCTLPKGLQFLQSLRNSPGKEEGLSGKSFPKALRQSSNQSGWRQTSRRWSCADIGRSVRCEMFVWLRCFRVYTNICTVYILYTCEHVYIWCVQYTTCTWV